jgi:hypothetical protein
MMLLECKLRLHLSEETISSWNKIQVLSKENHSMFTFSGLHLKEEI